MNVARFVCFVHLAAVAMLQARVLVALATVLMLPACSLPSCSSPLGSEDEVVTPVAANRIAEPPPSAPTSKASAEAAQLYDHTPTVTRPIVERRIPHATDAFTQGLLWHDGALWESCGRYSQSSLRKVELSSGKVLQQAKLPDNVFAEGLARVGDELVQVSWKQGIARVWQMQPLKVVREHRYQGEGWGLCNDGARLVMSNGSSRLVFRDPATFNKLSDVTVTTAGKELPLLNELECARGLIYANVWHTDFIVAIDPETGRVLQQINASQLLTDKERATADELNGIAYLPDSDTFIITGKLWPAMFEVQLRPAR